MIVTRRVDPAVPIVMEFSPAEAMGLIIELQEAIQIYRRNGGSFEQLTRMHDTLAQAFGVTIKREGAP